MKLVIYSIFKVFYPLIIFVLVFLFGFSSDFMYANLITYSFAVSWLLPKELKSDFKAKPRESNHTAIAFFITFIGFIVAERSIPYELKVINFKSLRLLNSHQQLYFLSGLIILGIGLSYLSWSSSMIKIRKKKNT